MYVGLNDVMLISDRCRKIQPSATLAVAAEVASLHQEGVEILRMDAGEPDFDTPLHIKAAAMDAIQEGKTKYTPVAGTIALRQAIVKKLEKQNKLTYSCTEVMASTGAKQAIFNALMATIDKGNEVIIPAPYWTSYPEMVNMAEGQPVFLPTDMSQQYKITAQQLKDAITPYTKMIILCSPSNPTGACYTEEELQALANVLVDYPNILILSDDVYEQIVWGEQTFRNIVNVVPTLRDRTILIHSLSKSYAMTGWRLGYAAAPEEIIAAMTKIQSQSTSNPCSITQEAGVEALGKITLESVSDMVAKYEKRHELICQRLDAIDGLRFIPAQGAFYLFVDASGLIEKLGLSDDTALATFFLREAHVSVVPGVAFGMVGHIRISFAIGKFYINQAFDQIEQAIKRRVEDEASPAE